MFSTACHFRGRTLAFYLYLVASGSHRSLLLFHVQQLRSHSLTVDSWVMQAIFNPPLSRHISLIIVFMMQAMCEPLSMTLLGLNRPTFKLASPEKHVGSAQYTCIQVSVEVWVFSGLSVINTLNAWLTRQLREPFGSPTTPTRVSKCFDVNFPL